MASYFRILWRFGPQASDATCDCLHDVNSSSQLMWTVRNPVNVTRWRP